MERHARRRRRRRARGVRVCMTHGNGRNAARPPVFRHYNLSAGRCGVAPPHDRRVALPLLYRKRPSKLFNPSAKLSKIDRCAGEAD
ncbi:hypothetical protein EVAR_46254_1 [Eumeta japonica]|uniref:Uncharacterized protein n=1 Tax=Eumeta variegata TaxID=151549 RepID=A0A4C1Y9Z1_EUMVA|nr:hypothetical protein EVAR_46254_1 [Eumeta japonica]